MIFRTNNLRIAALLLFILPFIFSLSQLGDQCQFSRDCIEGYCLNSTCRIPSVIEKYYTAGDCNSTFDCLNGFCYQNQCVIPSRDPAVAPLAASVSNSCAGLIENCTGFWCVFCNATWIILIIGAAAAAFITRKKGRLTPIILFILPVLSGLIFFPFLGSIIAVLELFLLAFLKPALIREMLQGKPKQPPIPPQQAEKQGEGMEQLPFD